MKELIYYPGFETQNIDWLKFSLLYVDKLNPIIPHSGDKFLSEQFQVLTNETDLLRIYRPKYKEGERATLSAIDITESILRNPEHYSRIFRNSDITKIWKNPLHHDYTLFEEKFTGHWKNFCLGNGLGTETDLGIQVPKDLGYVYMTVLAQVIADEKGISPITDHRNFDRFSIATRQTNNTNAKTKIAQGIIQLKLPSNISQISLADVIKFRNRESYKSQLKAFHSELDKYWGKIEAGSTEQDFVTSFDKIWSDFTGNVVKLGLDTMKFGLGVWILANSPSISTEEFLKNVVITGASSLVVSPIIGFKNTWDKTKSERYTRKYLSDLTTLK